MSPFCHPVGTAGELPAICTRGPTESYRSFQITLAVTKVPTQHGCTEAVCGAGVNERSSCAGERSEEAGMSPGHPA